MLLLTPSTTQADNWIVATPSTSQADNWIVATSCFSTENGKKEQLFLELLLMMK
jgi:hypothetical protein